MVIQNLHSNYDGDLLHHLFTITYTIPSDTPSDSVIICNPVNMFETAKDYYEFEKDRAIGFSFKIINETTHNFTIKNASFDKTIINALKNENAIFYDNGYKIKINDETIIALGNEHIPHLTTNTYFKNYVTWLNDGNYSTPNKEFVQAYYNNYANSENQKFLDYINYLIETTSITMDDVIETLIRNEDNSISRIKDTNKAYFRHVECELIRLMLNYLYNKSLGMAFIANTIPAWDSVENIHRTVHNHYLDTNNQVILVQDNENEHIVPYQSWAEINPEGLTVQPINDIINNNINIFYNSTGKVISGGIALLWHTSDGLAMKDVTVFAPPEITITLATN